MTQKDQAGQPKNLDQLQTELAKLRLDLKANKLKDTSALKKVRYKIALLKTKL